MEQFWTEALSEDKADALLTKVADQIKRRKMEVPAVFFLEMHKPLANVGASATLAFSPFIIPFIGFDAVNDYSNLMRKRENWERLIQLLEDKTTKSALEEPSA
ncbi:MAG: hypothetical protein JST40_03825 [Armatimonadetes bacterium]|nr:hypothetical protein [Armatimonadota bacterium]